MIVPDLTVCKKSDSKSPDVLANELCALLRRLVAVVEDRTGATVEILPIKYPNRPLSGSLDIESASRHVRASIESACQRATSGRQAMLTVRLDSDTVFAVSIERRDKITSFILNFFEFVDTKQSGLLREIADVCDAAGWSPQYPRH